MPKLKGPTFKSYVADTHSNIDETKGPKGTINHDEHQQQKNIKSKSVFHDAIMEDPNYMEPELLPGEMLVCCTQNVLRFIPYTDLKQGISGKLMCTNFRVIFVTADPSIAKNCSYQQNRLIGENDIALNNIDILYHVSKGKKRKLTDVSSSISHIKTIEILSKDFRIHTFSFKLAAKPETKTMIHAIVHHAFPTRLELLFAFDFQPSANNHTTVKDSFSTKIPPYYDRVEDWNEELERLNVVGYRADTFNTGFKTCPSLPEVFVVASSLTYKDVREAAAQYFDNRPPLWSYSCRNGASLIRMAYLTPEHTQTDVETKMFDAIQQAHHALDPPVTIDLTVLFPSTKLYQDCFVKLKHLCTPHNLKQTLTEDNNWYSNLNDTNWLGCVRSCLKIAVRVVDCMAKKRKTVIIKELENRDFAPLICSLVQLLLDPHYRTIEGLQSLIQREWVSMGYRFTHRSGLLSHSDSESPLFLLFLDCIWQLLQQFPTAFEFSETYLVMLWDSSCLGLFHTFIFNSEHNRYFAQHGFSTSGNKRPFKLLSAWDWSQQYHEDQLALCKNPLYLTHTHLNLDLSSSKPKYTDYPYRQGGLHALPNSKSIIQNPPTSTGVLRPAFKIANLQFWAYFYLRWLTPVQIPTGGSPAGYLQQCILIEDIICLQHRVEMLQKQKPFKKKDRRSSQLVFSNWEDSLEEGERVQSRRRGRWNESLTSSFPYTSSMVQVSFFGTPIDLMLSSSIFGSTADDDDDDSGEEEGEVFGETVEEDIVKGKREPELEDKDERTTYL